MNDLSGIKDLFRHLHWADALVWQAVSEVPEVEKEVQIMELLYHIHSVQHAYLQIWKQQSPEIPEFNDFPNISALMNWGKEYHEEIPDFLSGVNEQSLEKIIPIPWAHQVAEHIGKSPGPVTLAETMWQVITHSTYHRGQVNRRIRELNEKPPLTDFIAWIWLGKPEAIWPDL